MAERGLALVELDPQASEPNAPYVVITADCENPKEIDDGVFVEQLPDLKETYKVGVCVADTSSLYNDSTIFDQAMANTEAKYWENPDKTIGYEPMIDLAAVKGYEFSAGNIRDALIVTFIVGCDTPPSNVEINFGKVEVAKNQNYADFWKYCMPGHQGMRFGRASAFILRHLRYTSDSYDKRVLPQSFKKVYKRMLLGEDLDALERGSRINEAYMIAANHLVGKTLAEEGQPGIYRVHDPRAFRYDEVIPRDLARYSALPGPHKGLGLTHYCRVTSPLRRLEDFVMSHQLRQRYEGRTVSDADTDVVAEAVQRLNARIAAVVASHHTPARNYDTEEARTPGVPYEPFAAIATA